MIRSGVMDCVMVDEQCVFCDVLGDAEKRKIPVIATTDKIMLGLPDRTNDPIDAIVDDLVNFKMPGVAVLDPNQGGEIGIRVAIAVKPKRAEAKIQNLITEEQFKEGIAKCTQCNECAFVCPPHIRISKLIADAVKGDLLTFSNSYEICVGCGKCEQSARRA